MWINDIKLCVEFESKKYYGLIPPPPPNKNESRPMSLKATFTMKTKSDFKFL